MAMNSTSNSANSTPIWVLQKAAEPELAQGAVWPGRHGSGALMDALLALWRRKGIALAGMALGALACAGLIALRASPFEAEQSLVFNQTLNEAMRSRVLALALDPEISALAAEAAGLSAGDIVVRAEVFGSRTLKVSAISTDPLVAMRTVASAVELVGARSPIGFDPRGPVSSQVRRWSTGRLLLLVPAAFLGLLGAGALAWWLERTAQPISDAAELSAITGLPLLALSPASASDEDIASHVS